MTGGELRGGMRVLWDVEIEMDDGVRLAADIYRPDDELRHAVILSYGPYGKGLLFADGYPDQWSIMIRNHPDVAAGSSNRYQSWEVAETAADVERELAGEATVRVIASRDPYEAPVEHPFVELVARITEATTLVGAPFWTDAALIAGAGIPTVLYGPAREGAHAEVEWVELASLERVREVIVRTAAEWCA